MSGTQSEAGNPYESPGNRSARDPGDSPGGGMVKSIIAAIIGLVSLIYLINPTFGVIELIPDNLPVVGNLDEATATALLLSSLAYFGWDMRSLFGHRKSNITRGSTNAENRRSSLDGD